MVTLIVFLKRFSDIDWCNIYSVTILRSQYILKIYVYNYCSEYKDFAYVYSENTIPHLLVVVIDLF